jgi:hypothetical protein
METRWFDVCNFFFEDIRAMRQREPFSHGDTFGVFGEKVSFGVDKPYFQGFDLSSLLVPHETPTLFDLILGE